MLRLLKANTRTTTKIGNPSFANPYAATFTNTREPGPGETKEKTIAFPALNTDISAYFGGQAQDDWRETFAPVMTGLICDQSGFATDAYKLGVAFNVQNLQAQKWYEDYTLKFAQESTIYAEGEIAELLQRAEREGWSIDKTTDQLGILFRGWEGNLLFEDEAAWVGDRLPHNRREMIARTETMRASNAGNYYTIKDFGARFKEWVSTHDARTRPSHVEAGDRYTEGADPGPIPIDEPFHVGGYPMMYPHDMSLGAPLDEVINCRCTLVPYFSDQDLDDLEADWQARQPKFDFSLDGEQLPFLISELQAQPAHLEGAHAKTVYRDAQGNAWLFKPDLTQARADTTGYKVMRLLGLDAPEAYCVEIEGRAGAIQRMWTDVVGQVRINSLPALSREQLREIQQHQVVDWLISQHDTNDGAMLLNSQGHVLAIDKGQAFKFFGRDKLHWTYSPNPNELIYNRLAQDYLGGRLPTGTALGYSDVKPIVDKIKALPDADFIAAIQPYADHAAAQGYIGSASDFVAQALKRKQGIWREFGNYYKSLQAEYDKLHGVVAAGAALVPKPAAPTGVVTPLDDGFVAAVERNGWAGKQLIVAGDDIRDGQVLVYQLERQGGGKVLAVECVVNPEAEAGLLAKLGISGPAPVSSASGTSYDPYWQKCLRVIKHINAHMTPGSPGYDGAISYSVMGDLVNLADQLYYASPATTAEQEMIDHYKQVLKALTGKSTAYTSSADVQHMADLVKAKWPQGGTPKFVQWTPAPVATPTAPGAMFQARHVKPWMLRAHNEAGKIKTDGSLFDLMGDSAIEVQLDSQRVAVYTLSGDSNPLSKAGRLVIYDRGYAGAASEIEEARAALGRLVDTRLATPRDVELHYLRRAGFAAKLENDYDYGREVLQKITPGMSVDDQITIHQQYWTGKLGKDVTKIKGYDPTMHFDPVWVGDGYKGEGSWGYFERFDVTDADLDAQMKDYALVHSLSSDDPQRFFAKILDGNGLMANTEERIRQGVYQGEGMSSAEDQRTGGANFLFTRIQKRSQWGNYNLTFDKRLLRRMDNVSYEYDMYGRQDAYSLSQRVCDIHGWQRVSSNSSNETLIRHGFDALTWVRQIVVYDDYAKTNLVAFLRGKGITKIGGKRIEDIVTTRY